MTVKFTRTKEEDALIDKIVQRAKREGIEAAKFDPLSLQMDLSACHANGCPLKLDALLEAESFDFVHDITGIRRHIDRSTGQLTDCFWPRFARTKEIA